MFHHILENVSCDDYWTEKLSDTYLALSYPIYYGCPNINDYFDSGMITSIDIRFPEKAIHSIESCMENDIYTTSVEKIREAKKKILNEYNLFAMLADYINKLEEKNSKEYSGNKYGKITIKPNFLGRKVMGRRKRFSNRLKQKMLF